MNGVEGVSAFAADRNIAMPWAKPSPGNGSILNPRSPLGGIPSYIPLNQASIRMPGARIPLLGARQACGQAIGQAVNGRSQAGVVAAMVTKKPR